MSTERLEQSLKIIQNVQHSQKPKNSDKNENGIAAKTAQRKKNFGIFLAIKLSKNAQFPIRPPIIYFTD